VNNEIDKYLAVTNAQIKAVSENIFDKNKCSTVRYFAK
jgi:hypothetical protein